MVQLADLTQAHLSDLESLYLVLGLGGTNSERGEGDHVFFALEKVR